MPSAAFFDLDKTLLPGSSLFPLAREAYRQRLFTLRDLGRMARDQARFQLFGAEMDKPSERAQGQTLEVVRGRTREEVIDFGRGVAREELLPRLYPQAVDLLARHKRAGHLVYIASAAPEDYVRILADELGLDGVIGSRGKISNGIYTGEMDGPLVHGPEKARRVATLAWQQGIDLATSWAYSDSVNDLPMLELVGNPVALNPDRQLLRVARQRGWITLDFRTTRRRTLIGSAVGAGAAAAGVAGYAVGYLLGRRATVRAPG
jgi:HAD superfamily hydrolase (TIGR01490 family)